jgi:hypothetical protein
MSIKPDDIIIKNPNIAQRLFEERMLVITAKDSMLHRFNEVGTHIWQILDNNLSVKEICNSIKENFEGFDPIKDYNDIISFLDTLEKKHLIMISKSD